MDYLAPMGRPQRGLTRGKQDGPSQRRRCENERRGQSDAIADVKTEEEATSQGLWAAFRSWKMARKPIPSQSLREESSPANTLLLAP